MATAIAKRVYLLTSDSIQSQSEKANVQALNWILKNDILREKECLST
jgi:hypothetical protein